MDELIENICKRLGLPKRIFVGEGGYIAGQNANMDQWLSWQARWVMQSGIATEEDWPSGRSRENEGQG